MVLVVNVGEGRAPIFSACPTCNQHEPCHQAPAGHLHPLPTPGLTLRGLRHLPSPVCWALIRFSKMAHFVPLRKLPFGKGDCQTSPSSCRPAPWHPSRHHLRQRSPVYFHLLPWVLLLLGALISLFSGFHKQSNGQS